MKLGKTMIKMMIWHLNDANKLFSFYFLFGGGGFPGDLVVKNLPANAGDTGRSPGSQSEQQNKTQAPFPWQRALHPLLHQGVFRNMSLFSLPLLPHFSFTSQLTNM